MYISKVHIENIRCFEKITLDFSNGNGLNLWTTILGDNSTGKTTLLKCIALGLCDESSAAGLLRESEEGYLRHDSEKDGVIEITLCNEKGKVQGIIKNTIKSYKNRKKGTVLFEKLEQKILTPKRNEFKSWDSWEDIFVCAYGIGRGVSGTGDITGYTSISAVYNLFNYSEGLQNPELVIRRISGNEEEDEKIRKEKVLEIKAILKNALNLPNDSIINIGEDGIKIQGGPFVKETSLRDISDGYKSTFQWVADFLGWALSFNSKHYKKDEIAGIVLVDAIEEHLHPKWQREIVNTLHKELFGKVQFIVTTHSPLIATGTVDHKDAELIELEVTKRNTVINNPIKKEEVKGMRADEVLRHDAFGLNMTASIGSESGIQKYGELVAKEELNEEEEKELFTLKKTLKNKYSFGDTQFEQDVEKAVRKTLTDMIGNPTQTHLIEIKKQLADIFKSKL